MAGLTKERALWLATESSFGTDPDADGSDYLYVPALSIGDLRPGRVLLPTNYAIGAPHETAPVAGADGWSFDFEVPLFGLAAAAGDGSAPGADDWLDKLLEHIFGSQTALSGEGVGTGSTTESLVLDTDAYGVQDLIPIWETALPTSAAPRTQWVLLAADAGTGTYGTLAPTLEAAPTTSGVAYGSNSYRFSFPTLNATLAFVYRMKGDTDYTLLGGRVSAASIVGELGQIMRLRCTVSGDTKTQESKGSLTSITQTTRTPIKTLASPVWWNGTKIATRSINIDLGLVTGEQGATSATNGRADIEVRAAEPVVTIEPLYSDSRIDELDAVTTGRVLVQLGAGVLSGGVLNTMAFHLEEAFVQEVTPADESGRQRQSVKLKCSHKVEFSTGVTARRVQLSRA